MNTLRGLAPPGGAPADRPPGASLGARRIPPTRVLELEHAEAVAADTTLAAGAAGAAGPLQGAGAGAGQAAAAAAAPGELAQSAQLERERRKAEALRRIIPREQHRLVRCMRSVNQRTL